MMNPELKTVMNKIRMKLSKKYFREFLLIRPEKYALGIISQDRDLKALSQLSLLPL